MGNHVACRNKLGCLLRGLHRASGVEKLHGKFPTSLYQKNSFPDKRKQRLSVALAQFWPFFCSLAAGSCCNSSDFSEEARVSLDFHGFPAGFDLRRDILSKEKMDVTEEIDMSVGMIILGVAGLLVLFGVGQRVLDKMRLTDRQALLFIALILALGFVPEIPLGGNVWVNLGGAVVPLILCVYLFVKAGSAKEKVRSVVAAILTGAAIYAMGRLLPDEPETMFMDPNYLYGIAAGVIAYVLGRSRRCAFIAGVTGMLLANIANAVAVSAAGVDQRLVLGGAGVYDAVVISGFLAVLLAELVGELIERATRGKKRPQKEFVGGEFVDRRHDG